MITDIGGHTTSAVITDIGGHTSPGSQGRPGGWGDCQQHAFYLHSAHLVSQVLRVEGAPLVRLQLEGLQLGRLPRLPLRQAAHLLAGQGLGVELARLGGGLSD